MIGLDTNILVRYITQDDKRQSRIASRIVESLDADHPGAISTVVLVKTVWVLQRSYQAPKETIVTVLERLLKATELSFEHRDEAWNALRLFRSSNVDFVDALIGLIHQSYGCPSTLTFDKSAAKMPFFKMAT